MALAFVSGGGGGGGANSGLVKLFESVLSGSAATIDTGANGVAAGHDDLLIVVNLRCDAAVGGVNGAFTFNNDSGNNYDLAWIRNAAGAITALDSHARPNIVMCQVSDTTFAAGCFAAAQITVAKYANTSTFKAAVSLSGPTADTTANDRIIFASGMWRSTVAINQIAVAPGSGNFIAGSSMTIYGTQ